MKHMIRTCGLFDCSRNTTTTRWDFATPQIALCAQYAHFHSVYFKLFFHLSDGELLRKIATRFNKLNARKTVEINIRTGDAVNILIFNLNFVIFLIFLASQMFWHQNDIEMRQKKWKFIRYAFCGLVQTIRIRRGIMQTRKNAFKLFLSCRKFAFCQQ